MSVAPLGVIILNWNQVQDTIACVRHVQRWPFDKYVWVVDNDSNGGDVERLRAELSDVRLIFSRANLGFAGGNNLALRDALQTTCVQAMLLINNDARAEGDAIVQLQRSLEQNPRLGIVGPVLVDAANPERVLSAGGRDIARHLLSHIRTPAARHMLHYVDYVPGTCVMIRAEVLRQVGLLDESYFFGGELADLCMRARRHGWLSAVDGSAVVRHAVDRSADLRSSLHIYYVIRNRFLYIRRFYPRTRWLLFLMWTAHALATSLLALAHGQRGRARAAMLGCWDGWHGRFGGQNARVTQGRIL